MMHGSLEDYGAHVAVLITLQDGPILGELVDDVYPSDPLPAYLKPVVKSYEDLLALARTVGYVEVPVEGEADTARS